MKCFVYANHLHLGIRSVPHHQNAASNRISPRSYRNIRSPDFSAHSEDRRREKRRKAGKTVAWPYVNAAARSGGSTPQAPSCPLFKRLNTPPPPPPMRPPPRPPR